GASAAEIKAILEGAWSRRADRGAEERPAPRGRPPPAAVPGLPGGPHPGRRTRGGCNGSCPPKGCPFPRRPPQPAIALLPALRHPHAGRLDDPVRLAPLDHVCGGTRRDPLHRDLSGGNVLPRRGRLPRLVPGAAGGVLPVAAPQVRGASLRDPAT